MSHEGIRFVSKEEQTRESLEGRPLPRIAVTPDKVRVKITEGTGLEIDWQDGHRSAWSFAWLRDACACAFRSSTQVAQGQASRSQAKLHALLCPSCQSISRPVPSVSFTRTFSGVTAM